MYKIQRITLALVRFSLPPLRSDPILGLEGIARSILQKLKQQRVEIPIYAIGGITSENVEP
jgi:thiamine-phosphate pyrophosphorylase